ncbi:MAG: glycosyltransferase [Oligoflexia bacterium]|nr:glycosyltransferase [Oligoflexia bacterium]
MKIAFYAPLKPITHENPSGDREIGRSVHRYFSEQNANIFILSEFRTRWFYRSPVRWMRFFIAFARAFRRAKIEQPDVYFTYHLYYKAPDPIACILAWWFSKPYFVFEGMYARKAALRPGRWIGFLFTKFALSYATKIFSDKTDDYNYLKQWFSEDRVVYLPPSIDLRNFFSTPQRKKNGRQTLGIASEEIVICTVAMLRPDRKTEGVEFLLECLAELKDEGLLFRWVHMGAGQKEEYIRDKAFRLLGHRAQLLGSVDSSKVAEVMASSDIFAFPGIDEGFGLVYVEAQASALPVVAFLNGGIADAVNAGSSGFLTTFMDKEEYKSALRKLMQDPVLRLRMGAAGVDFVTKNFNSQLNYKKIWNAMLDSVPLEKR